MGKTKVLITVKTYPTLSKKYDELVCTAGFLEDGSWIRIYPIPFRQKAYQEQYRKYEWIELDLVKNEKDFRPESYRPKSLNSEIVVIGKIDTNNNWQERKKVCLNNVHYNFAKLMADAKNPDKVTSLAVFKPTEILDFYAEKTTREWDKKRLAQLNQLNLFDVTRSGKFEVVRKMPYKFKFLFKDDAGEEIRLMIEDWETAQLYWKQLAKYEGDESRAIADVKKKYFDDFAKTKDLYFFLGTLYENHAKNYPNIFAIIGTFHPKIETQYSLF